MGTVNFQIISVNVTLKYHQTMMLNNAFYVLTFQAGYILQIMQTVKECDMIAHLVWHDAHLVWHDAHQDTTALLAKF